MPGHNSATQNSALTKKASKPMREKGPLPAGGRSVPDEEELSAYIENGNKLRSELLVNHAAMNVAKQEYVSDYKRRRS